MVKSKSNLIKFTTGIFFALQIIAATVILTCPSPARAIDVNFTPQTSIPGSSFVAESPSLVTGSTIASYIGAIYNYGMAIAGILATLVLMGAGVIWLTSGGDSGKITQAKELISGSIAGLLILVVSWVILNTINPDLVNLKSISPTHIEGVTLGCCEQAKDDGKIKMTTPANCTGTFYENRTLNNGKCEGEGCCIYTNPTFSQSSTCFRAFPGACSAFLKNSKGVFSEEPGKIVENTCSNVPECQGKSAMLSCDGIQDGKKVGDNEPFNNLFCYNGLIYYRAGGLLSEPCGIIFSGGYGTCVDKSDTCIDRNQLGGRWCGEGLKCCLD